MDQRRNKIRTQHYSIRTEKAYVDWVKRFMLFHNKRHPAERGAAEVEQFLTHLAVNGNVAAATQHQALSIMLFLYRKVLGGTAGVAGKRSAGQAAATGVRGTNPR